MKGQNELVLNHEAMAEVVQDWLTRMWAYPNAPRVLGVRAEPNGAHEQFRISVTTSGREAS